MLKNRILYTFALFLLLNYVKGETMGGRAYTRYPRCRAHESKDDAYVQSFIKDAIPILSTEKAKGYMGTIGILGGNAETFGGLYFMGMAALRVGADEVHIYCTTPSAVSLRVLSPDFVIHPLIDVDVNRMITHMMKMDVIVLGHGLDLNQHSINVINLIIPQVKQHKKPLVIDLDEYFYTPAFLNLLNNFPEPGVIILANQKEFEKIYAHVRAKDAYGDAQVNIDFERLGPNVLIYRKGCTDMAFTKNPSIAWSYSDNTSHRRSVGQGCVITGATAIYFRWAEMTLAQNSTLMKDRLLPASVATYSGATLMRKVSKRGVEDSKSVVTSDMINLIGDVVAG